jgi:hypothetical protein
MSAEPARLARPHRAGPEVKRGPTGDIVHKKAKLRDLACGVRMAAGSACGLVKWGAAD